MDGGGPDCQSPARNSRRKMILWQAWSEFDWNGACLGVVGAGVAGKMMVRDDR